MVLVARTPAMGGRRPLRRPLAVGLLLLVAGLLLAPASGALADERGPFVDVVELHGVLDRTLAGHVADVLGDARPGEVTAVVVEIDSPGALGDSAARVVDAVEASEVPVIAWVGPAGSWAVGGALAVVQAADVVAASPGTLVGPEAPLDLASGPAADGGVLAIAGPGETDAVLPEGAPLPDGVERADVAVRPADELADAGVLDLTASTLPALVEALHGLEVGDAALDTVASTVRFHNLGIVGQVLHALTNPVLVYLLLVGGALALLFEVFQPGFGVAGISGLMLLALGAGGLVILPASLLGAALTAAGLLLLAADLALARLGVLTAGGAVAFAAGSVLLFTGPPLLDVPYWLVGLVTVGNVVFFVGVMTTVLRAQGNQAFSGAERLIGETAVVRSMLNPEGHVFVQGALWRARAPEAAGRLRTGTPVRVVGLNERLTLDVEPIEDGDRERTPERSSAS